MAEKNFGKKIWGKKSGVKKLEQKILGQKKFCKKIGGKKLKQMIFVK